MPQKYTAILIIAVIVLASAGISLGSVNQILNADYEALERPLSPYAAPGAVARISARLGYLWKLPDNSQAMVLLGDFRLELPEKVLTSRDAVVWLTLDRRGGQRLKKLEVFMEGQARIVETSGAVLEDQVLFVTVYTAAKIELLGQGLTDRSGANQPIYPQALRARSKSVTPITVSPEQLVVRGPATQPAEPKSRRPITIVGSFEIRAPKDAPPMLICTDGIYVIQSAEPGGEATELRATNAVVFLKQAGMKRRTAKTPDTKPSPEQRQEQFEKLPTEEEAAGQLTAQDQAAMNQYVSAAYLEGDVVLSRGHRQIRADRIYYDFEQGKAIIDDLVASTVVPSRNLSIYIRAKRARQLSERQYVATAAKISTSEFYTPSYHVGATTVYFEDRTERTETGELVGLAAGKFRAYNATFNVQGVPILYWPYLRGDFKQSETALKRIRTSYDTEFGITGQTRWHLFPLLGLDEPEGTDGTLRLDYYGERGPAAGVDVDYERDTYFGLLRSYWLRDTGEDQLGGLRGDVKPPHKNRGRFLVRHRHYLPNEWELTLEASYLSDRHFLEEFFRSEFDEGKEQETLLYVKKPLGDDTIFSLIGKARINDFLTQTEYLPEGRLDILGKSFFDGQLTWYSENRFGAVRRRVDNDIPNWWFWLSPRLDDTDTVFRADSRQEIEIPFDLDPLKLVAFASLRGTAWDDSPFDRGGLERVYATYGLRGSLYQWKVFDSVESRMFDLHQLRHIMREDFTVWASHTNVGSQELTPFDQALEILDEVDGFTLGWRHRLQTKRGGPGHWRTVDWLTLDLEAGIFNDVRTTDARNRTRGQVFSFKPENSITSNYASLQSIWRVSDTTALLYDAIVDVNDGRIGSSGLGLHIDRDPRLSWFLGHRFIGLTDSNLLGFGANYRLNKKYTLAIHEQFDLDRGRNADIAVTILRRMPRWYLAITLEFDQIENVDSVSISIWPEGIPEWTVGSRRYGGLGTSTGLRP